MGYSPVFMSDIIALKRRGLLDGCRRVVEIGAQQINDSIDHFDRSSTRRSHCSAAPSPP